MKKDFTKQDFYDLLKPNGDCLEWTRSTQRFGYGQTGYDGTVISTHRLALILEGIDVTNKVVMHSCDNPCCCNPAHLSVGTYADNTQDMVNKMRHCYGENNGTAEQTEQDVLHIRDHYSKGVSQKDLAEMFNTTRQNIWLIVHRKSWAHI